MKILFSNYYLKFVCIFQYICWYISIIYLFKLISLLTNHKIALWGSIIYSIVPAIVGWNCNILTESLALSGTLIYVYYVINYIKNNKSPYGDFRVNKLYF